MFLAHLVLLITSNNRQVVSENPQNDSLKYYDVYSPTEFESYRKFQHQMNLAANVLLQDPAKRLNDDNRAKILSKNDSENVTLFQGDIILTVAQMQEILESATEQMSPTNATSEGRANLTVQKRKFTSTLSALWPMPVYYDFDKSTNVAVEAIEAGLSLWQNLTCVVFKRITKLKPADDYILFFKGEGCWSAVGRKGGKQLSSINSRCVGLGVVAHEIAHSLGVWHEHARPDRDLSVTVEAANLAVGAAQNFIKLLPGDVELFDIPYDYGSVMHYSPSAFSKSSKLFTLIARDLNYQHTMGQRTAVSFYDAKFINSAYCSDVCKVKLPCKHSGYMDPKNCSICRCPEGFAGMICEDVDETSDDCAESPELRATNQWQQISESGVKRCNWLIKAYLGKVIRLELEDLSFQCTPLCAVEYLEIKYHRDKGITGARFCCNESRPSAIISRNNEVLLLYKGWIGTKFVLRFKQELAVPSVMFEDAAAEHYNGTTDMTEFPDDALAPMTKQASRAVASYNASERHGVWTNWTDYGPCTATCGACGTTTRSRTCIAVNTTDCGSNVREQEEAQSCSFNVCIFSKQKRSFAETSIQPAAQLCCPPFVVDASRTTCVLPSKSRRVLLPEAKINETQTIVDDHTAPVWDEWSNCSVPCGGCGAEYRSCLKGACLGQRPEKRSCNFNPCTYGDCFNMQRLLELQNSLLNATTTAAPIPTSLNGTNLLTEDIGKNKLRKENESNYQNDNVPPNPILQRCACCPPFQLVHGICQ